MSRLRRHDFDLPRALVLGGLIALGLCLPLGPARSAALEDTLGNAVFEGRKFGMPAQVTFLEDGRLMIEGALGSYGGTWRVFDGRLCVWSEFGPLPRQGCHEIEQVGSDELRLPQGVTLRRIAGVRAF